MASKILLPMLVLLAASCIATNSKYGCQRVSNKSPLCTTNTLRSVCLCDFTCSEWYRPCNWVITCKKQVKAINKARDTKNKLNLFMLSDLNRDECLDINLKVHNHTNCCHYFCKQNVKDKCI